MFRGARATLLGSLMVLSVGVLVPACERSVPPAPAAAMRAGVRPADTDLPNLILIVQDALRADCLGAYGHPGGLSPTVDALASEGTTFEYCVAAAPWTLPSMASVFVGYYPGVHKAAGYRVQRASGARPAGQVAALHQDFTTLAEALRDAGYQTAAFSANKFIRPGVGFDQGFEHIDISFAANTVRGEVVNEAALTWLDDQRDATRPLFLYLHFMDVHGPYNAAPRFTDPLLERVETAPEKQRLSKQQWERLSKLYLCHPPSGRVGDVTFAQRAEQLRKKLGGRELGEAQRRALEQMHRTRPPPRAIDRQRFERLKLYRAYWVARYEGGVAEGDHYLDQLVRGLRERGLWDDTYVVFMADHGEALGEHGYWDHGYSMHQTDLHVPLILRWPGIVPAGRRVPFLTSLVDLLPTLLEQLRLPADERLQGTSLVGSFSGNAPDIAPTRFAEASKSQLDYAIFADHLKLIGHRALGETFCMTQFAPDDQHGPQLYDLARDPGEQHNLAATDMETAARLVTALNDRIELNRNLRPEIESGWAPLEDKLVQQLRTLGYVGDEHAAEENPEPDDPNDQP